MNQPSSAKPRFEWAPWLFVVAGVVILATLGTVMSRVRSQPTVRGVIAADDVDRLVAVLQAEYGPGVRINELGSTPDADVMDALIDDGQAFDRRFQFLTLRRDAKQGWRITERRPWP